MSPGLAYPEYYNQKRRQYREHLDGGSKLNVTGTGVCVLCVHVYCVWGGVCVRVLRKLLILSKSHIS